MKAFHDFNFALLFALLIHHSEPSKMPIVQFGLAFVLIICERVFDIQEI